MKTTLSVWLLLLFLLLAMGVAGDMDRHDRQCLDDGVEVARW
jgi:hypothetical protein